MRTLIIFMRVYPHDLIIFPNPTSNRLGRMPAYKFREWRRHKHLNIVGLK
jgi:hypothetical protein